MYGEPLVYVRGTTGTGSLIQILLWVHARAAAEETDIPAEGRCGDQQSIRCPRAHALLGIVHARLETTDGFPKGRSPTDPNPSVKSANR